MLPRALRALLLLAWTASFAVVPAAHGASVDSTCVPVAVQDSTKNAMAVFVGTVTAVQGTAKGNGERGAFFDHTVTVNRVYQGKINTATVAVRTDKTPRECSLGKLTVGYSYMFFVVGDGNPWVATGQGGTQIVTDDVVAQVVRFLGEGRDPLPPASEHAVFTPVHPDPPQSLSRAAAPGAALVLVGLLGLVLARGRSRRR